MNYNFVTIEGCIGAGKTTLSSMLAAEFNANLILEEFENNPFLAKFYEDPERHAFTVELFFMAERFHHLKNLLSKADLFKSFTISDFHFQKSQIFASQTLNENEEKLYRTLFDIINTSLPKPDLVIYLYAPVELLLQNIRKRGRAYEQQISSDYLDKIQKAYLEYFKYQTNSSIVLLDTENINFVDNESDFRFLTDILKSSFPNGITSIKKP
jgi:deoxyguanosine kinase